MNFICISFHDHLGIPKGRAQDVDPGPLGRWRWRGHHLCSRACVHLGRWDDEMARLRIYSKNQTYSMEKLKMMVFQDVSSDLWQLDDFPLSQFDLLLKLNTNQHSL